MSIGLQLQGSRVRVALYGGLLAIAATWLLAAVSPASAAEGDINRYIVVLNDDVAHPGNVAHRHAENRGARTKHVFRHALNGYSANMSAEDVAAVRRDPSVDYVVRARVLHAAAQSQSTGVRRVFAPNNATLDIDGVDDVQVNADVAVLDSGIDYDHPDLRVVARTNCATASGEPPHYCVDNSGDDGDGHGTHVAGIIGARDNGIGTVGVAPSARLWAVKVLDDEGSGWSDEIVAGIDWITARAGQIEVANMSLGGPYIPSLDQPMMDAITEAVDAGIVVVVAAGNDQIDARYEAPANHNDVITVSALADFDGQAGSLQGYKTCYDTGAENPHADVDDTLAYFSNWGLVVDMTAPGECIYSTYKNGGYATFSGTSMAAPHVAGAAAILAAVNNPNSDAGVDSIMDDLYAQGNSNWVQDWNGVNHDAQDSVKEPLLDVHDPIVFSVRHPGNVNALSVTSHVEDAMQLFARNEGGRIWAKDYNPFANPAGWQGWGTVSLPVNASNGQSVPIVGAPAVISRHSCCRDLFVRGTDNQLYFRNWDSNVGAWSSWFWIPGPNNSTISSSPAAVANPGIKDAFTLVVRGSNNQIYLRNYDPASGWSAWMSLGVPTGGATSNPTVAIHDYGVIHVMVRGGDNAIWDRAWSAANGWTPWISLGGTLTSAPALVTTNNEKDLFLFSRGTDNAIWFRRGTSLGWTSWASLGGSWISEPAATTRDGYGVDVFAVGTDGKVQNRRYVYGAWTKWMRIDDDCPPGAC